MDYSELVKSLRICAIWKDKIRFPGKDGCNGCAYHDKESDVCTSWDADELREHIMLDAADAIEKLLRAAKKMHTWIFLHTWDEQEAYDECGMSNEMNAALGYSGQFELRAEQPKEETE